VDAKTAFYAVPAQQLPSRDDAKFSLADVMGVALPLSSIMVLTLAGNLMLHLKIRAGEKELALC
jgi:hypothetical protein